MREHRCRKACTLVLLGLCLVLTSCGKKELPLAEVTGQVTYLGAPASAEVIFRPNQTDIGAGERPSSAMTDEKGNFRLFFTLDQPGALVGQHTVIIRVLRTEFDAEPETFGQATSAKKRVELERYVNRGDNHFHFAITP